MKRSEEAQREMDFAMGLRPNDGNAPYNCACINCKLTEGGGAHGDSQGLGRRRAGSRLDAP